MQALKVTYTLGNDKLYCLLPLETSELNARLVMTNSTYSDFMNTLKEVKPRAYKNTQADHALIMGYAQFMGLLFELNKVYNDDSMAIFDLISGSSWVSAYAGTFTTTLHEGFDLFVNSIWLNDDAQELAPDEYREHIADLSDFTTFKSGYNFKGFLFKKDECFEIERETVFNYDIFHLRENRHNSQRMFVVHQSKSVDFAELILMYLFFF